MSRPGRDPVTESSYALRRLWGALRGRVDPAAEAGLMIAHHGVHEALGPWLGADRADGPERLALAHRLGRARATLAGLRNVGDGLGGDARQRWREAEGLLAATAGGAHGPAHDPRAVAHALDALWINQGTEGTNPIVTALADTVGDALDALDPALDHRGRDDRHMHAAGRRAYWSTAVAAQRGLRRITGLMADGRGRRRAVAAKLHGYAVDLPTTIAREPTAGPTAVPAATAATADAALRATAAAARATHRIWTTDDEG